jgi:twinfilin
VIEVQFYIAFMARSNLNISTLLTEAFLTAQNFSNGTRCIKVLIEGEDLILSTITTRVGSAEADFDRLASTVLKENGATILLFCLSDQDAEKLNWLLLPFIPDNCKVREKMLYSSSRDDLKRALGIGFFSQDYAANTLSEVTWDLLKAYLSNDRKEEYLSEKERVIRDEKVRSID